MRDILISDFIQNLLTSRTKNLPVNVHVIGHPETATAHFRWRRGWLHLYVHVTAIFLLVREVSYCLYVIIYVSVQDFPDINFFKNPIN